MPFLFFKTSYSIIYLFMAALGLHCCAWAFSSCGEQGLLFVEVRRLLIAVASLVAEHGLQGARASVVVALGLSSCGSWAQLLCGMWDLPGPGLEPVSRALAGGFLTTAPPGKPLYAILKLTMYLTTGLKIRLSSHLILKEVEWCMA